MAYNHRISQTEIDTQVLEPWHVVQNGVLLCADEMGFLKVQPVLLRKVVSVLKNLMSKEYKKVRFGLEAEDIALEAFENTRKRVSRHGLSLDHKNGFETYLLSSAKRLLVKIVNESRRFESGFDKNVPADPLSALKRERWLEVRRRTVREVFEDCFKDKPMMKEVLYRSVVNEEDHRTIASDLGLTVENSRKLKERGLERLKRKFEKLTDPPWDDGFMDRIGNANHGSVPWHVPSVCENNMNRFSLYCNVHMTEERRTMEKPERLRIPAGRKDDSKPSGNTRRRKTGKPQTGISDRKLAYLFKLLRESYHGHAGSEDNR